MLVPLEIDYRDVEKTIETENLIRARAEKLERVCNYINSCRVMVEKVQKHWHTHQAYHVRLDIRVPPGHEIAVSRDGGKSVQHLELDAEIRWAFETAEKQLKELVQRQSGNVKLHTFQNVQGVIRWVDRGNNCGFISTVEGREVYFHKNSVLHNRFDDLKPGMGVRFSEEMGENGPQVTSLQIVQIPESL